MAAGRGGTGRLLGLGFLFGGKDDGATKTAKSVGEGMDALADATERTAKQSTGLMKFGNALNALNFLQLDRIGNAMEGLAEKAGIGPGGAANSIESFGVQFGQSFKQATAGLGKYTGEVKKYKGAIAGSAFNLGVDAGELTGTVAMLVKTGNKVEDYGLSVRAVAGSMQAGILGGEQLGEILTSLSESYDMGAKRAGLHLDKITALGEMFGVGKEAAAGLEGALSAADPVLAKFTNLKVDTVTESITRLALAGQQRLGGKFQDRMQDAIGVFNELAGAREQMGELVTGLGSDFPELAKEIGIASGDVGKSMEQILSDPLSFAKNMQKLMSSMDKSDPRFQRLKLSLGKLPAGFNFLIDGGEASAKALEAASAPVKNFEGAFKKMATSSSGAARTFSEQMDLLQESFENRLNKMTSQTDAQVVKRQAKAWKKLGDTINKMRGSKSPIGKFGAGFLQVMLDIRRHGLIHGLIPLFEKMAKGNGPFGKFFKKVAGFMPMLEGLGEGFITLALGAGKLVVGLALIKGPLGALFGTVGKGFGMLTKLPLPLMAIAGIGLLIYKNWDLIRPTLKAIWDVLSTELAPAFDEVGGVASEVWANMRAGVAILWKELKGFGKWFMNNLPAMIAAGAETIVASVAYIRFGIKRMWIFGKYAFSNLSTHAQMFGSAAEVSIGYALDGLRISLDMFREGWMLMFQSMKLGLSEIPLQLAKFMQSMINTLPKKLLDTLGLGSVVNGIDDTVKYWEESTTKTMGEIDSRIDQSEEFRRSLADERNKREMRHQELVSKLARSDAEEAAEVLDAEVERDRTLNRGRKMGRDLQDRLTDVIAHRDDEEEAPKKSSKKRRRKGRRTPAQVQAERMAVTAPAGGGGGGAAGPSLDQLMLGIENAVARGSERGAARGAEQGVKMGTKRVVRPAEAGGVER